MERVLHELVDFPLWTLFLTKNCPLYSPPVRTQATDASTRLGEPRYIRPRPFVAFDFDIHDIARLNEEPILQLQKPMLEYAKVDHISAYGRPLWWTYHEKPYEDIHLFVDSKLMAGQSFNPRVLDHAFAAVSFRVLLEPTWSDILSWQLALTAVELHLRLVVSIDIERGMIRTASGSEPIVADAAQHQLCRTPRSWQKALRTLWDDLFSQGRIAKGEKGELLARILLVLARDMTVRRVDLPHAIGSAPVGDPGLKDEYTVPSCFPVTAWELLTALLGDKLEETLDCAARSSERSNRVSKPYFEDAKIDFKAFLKKGYINLNHMTTTSMPLSEGCTNFLNLLLRRGAAVQLGSGWSYWDILIPMYVGDPSEPFDPFKVTAIAIQVNKRSQPEAVFEGKDLERFFFVKDAHYVHLHLDLGQESASGVSKSRFYRSETSVVLDLHVEGHEKRTYPPLGHFGVDSTAKKMMEESTRLSEDEHILGDALKGCNAYTGKPYDMFSREICKELAKASDKDTEDISDESGSLHMEQD
ncbi:hypothetical protein BDN72DRAFT_902309 [Pluteus cervinus]|uniref:Uncharacterized protein n=1 Tax=Pluteus cervinus TaxID=181527 RepID=A0ACD3ACC3_9AGAR|nr:hypothetical protein BDN72DRAFT_902309 [Pluteus cervinus]